MEGPDVLSMRGKEVNSIEDSDSQGQGLHICLMKAARGDWTKRIAHFSCLLAVKAAMIESAASHHLRDRQ